MRGPHGNAAGMAVTRRTVLRATGAGLLGAATGSLVRPVGAVASPVFWRRPAVAGSGGPGQLHLTYGADPATAMTASWATDARVQNPRLRLGTPAGGYGATMPALTRTYTAAATATMPAQEVVTQHVPMTGLLPGTTYVFQVLHDGAPAPVTGSFTTPAQGRFPFRFSSFGDQGTGNPNDVGFTPQAVAVVDHINRAAPLFHLLNGDLAYSDLQQSTVGAWTNFFTNNQPSASTLPWMPALGNHENETGNGPQGFAGYLTRYLLPGNGSADFAGNWYAFLVGNVQVISLDADDVVYQDSGNFYIRGYSAGAQRAWLRNTLAAARADRAVDWIVVFQHMAVISSSQSGNGCDLGLRQQFQPLFDEYGVDLVLCGHEHDYERSYSLRGFDHASPTLKPAVVSTGTDVVDSTRGTVYLVLGGGGFALPTNVFGGTPSAPTAKVNVAKGTTATETADWSFYRDTIFPFGFATFDVDPGRPGGLTSITVTYFHTTAAGAAPAEVERFVLQRPRSDTSAAGTADRPVIRAAGTPTPPPRVQRARRQPAARSSAGSPQPAQPAQPQRILAYTGLEDVLPAAGAALAAGAAALRLTGRPDRSDGAAPPR